MLPAYLNFEASHFENLRLQATNLSRYLNLEASHSRDLRHQATNSSKTRFLARHVSSLSHHRTDISVSERHSRHSTNPSIHILLFVVLYSWPSTQYCRWSDSLDHPPNPIDISRHRAPHLYLHNSDFQIPLTRQYCHLRSWFVCECGYFIRAADLGLSGGMQKFRRGR